ncbi:MAG: hypothetical protein ACR2GP_09400 [Burkholderiaceae bacterium]
MRACLSILGLVLLLGSASAAEPITIAQVHALDQRCEAARTAKLEPIRARKVEQCIARDKRSRDECATFFSTYGNNSSRVSGGVVRGQFYDLPQCVVAKKALRRMQAARANQ